MTLTENLMRFHCKLNLGRIDFKMLDDFEGLEKERVTQMLIDRGFLTFSFMEIGPNAQPRAAFHALPEGGFIYFSSSKYAQQYKDHKLCDS